MSEQFTFVRHMIKTSSPEAIQAAIEAGTLSQPYIANITQDSSTEGYSSKGIYIQESSAGVLPVINKEYVPDSSHDSSTGPTLSWTTDIDYAEGFATFTPEISGDDSYYDSVAFFVVDSSTIDGILEEHGGYSHGDVLWSLIESDAVDVYYDSSSGDEVELGSILDDYFDNQSVYVYGLLEHYNKGNRDFYQPIPTDDNYAYALVEWIEAEEPTAWWEDFNFDDEPADTDMIEHYEQSPGDEEAMSTLYTLSQDELGIINNALGGNRTLEAAIVVNPTVTEDDGEFSISGGRAIIGDASSNFIAFEDCSIGFDDDSYLVIKSIKNAPANGILSSPPAYVTVENYYSILHFGSQDLALLRIDIDGSNSNWINVNASRWSSNTPIPDASTAWYQNVNFEGDAPNYNDIIDTNAVEEEYSNFADAVSSLTLDNVFNNPEPGETWTNNYVISLVIGGTYSTGYLSGGRQVPGTININAKTITFNNVSFTSDQMIYLVVDNCSTAPCDTPFESYTVIYHSYSITRAVAGQNSGATCTITATLDEWDNITGVEFDYGNSGEGGDDSSTDVSLGYKFSVGANNGGYFNTGYVPGADTVVQLKGKIINDGASAHGIKGNYSDWMYRIFGNEGDVYFDRMDDQVRIVAAVNDIENTSHEYEFGNYYIKVDGVTEATDSESDLSNFYTELSLLVFATSQIGAMGETILDTLAAPGTEVEYFKILEPDGNGGLNLEKDLRPALDASGNVCLYDQVAGDIIYPEGSSVNIIATAVGGDEPGPDSSTSSTDIIAVHGNPGPTPTAANPFVTLVVDASIAALSSWDHMEVGIYSLSHYENNGYSSINDYRQNGFIKTCTIALTDGTAHYSIQSTDDLDCNEIPAGDGYTFTGYDDTICVVAWFEIGYGAQQVAESNEIFELYEYELPRDL